jgi:hypothetical protein
MCFGWSLGQSNCEIAASLVLAERTGEEPRQPDSDQARSARRWPIVVYVYEAGVVPPGPRR